MKCFNYLLLAILLSTLCLSHGQAVEPEGTRVEDDMRLTAEQVEHLQGNGLTRNVMLWSRYYWPKKELVYSIQGFTAADEAQIWRAMSGITAQACVRFRRTYSPNEPQVAIQRKDNGCWSYVGYHGTRQALNLGPGCMSIGTIQHELLHALSMLHMQSDPNRNRYIRIAYENIASGYEGNFAVHNAKDVGDFGYGYDYGSVMHYGPYAFSKNGRATIIPLQSGVTIGQRNGLSSKDILKLRRMYC